LSQKQFCFHTAINTILPNVILLNIVTNDIRVSASLLNVVVPISLKSQKQFCSLMVINAIMPNVIHSTQHCEKCHSFKCHFAECSDTHGPMVAETFFCTAINTILPNVIQLNIVTNGILVSASLLSVVVPISPWSQKQFCSRVAINAIRPNVILLNIVTNGIQVSASLLNVVVLIGPWSQKQFCSRVAINAILPNFILLNIVTNGIQVSASLLNVVVPIGPWSQKQFCSRVVVCHTKLHLALFFNDFMPIS
jgi:hypothetical protein